MRQILTKMEYTRHGHVVLVIRNKFCLVGHTTPKTKEMIKKAMSEVLLVNKAYYLYNTANEHDYYEESTEILLNVIKKKKQQGCGDGRSGV